MSKSMEELMELVDKMPDEPAKPGEFLLPELMAIAVAHEVRDDDIVFAGTGLPMVGIMAANLLNAPHALLIYESGICDGKTMHVPMSVCDQRAANLSSTLGGLVDTFGYLSPAGLRYSWISRRRGNRQIRRGKRNLDRRLFRAIPQVYRIGRECRYRHHGVPDRLHHSPGKKAVSWKETTTPRLRAGGAGTSRPVSGSPKRRSGKIPLLQTAAPSRS